jgi:hypothetical protein
MIKVIYDLNNFNTVHSFGTVKLYNIGWGLHGMIFDIEDEDDLVMLKLSTDKKFTVTNDLHIVPFFKQHIINPINVGSWY